MNTKILFLFFLSGVILSGSSGQSLRDMFRGFGHGIRNGVSVLTKPFHHIMHNTFHSSSSFGHSPSFGHGSSHSFSHDSSHSFSHDSSSSSFHSPIDNQVDHSGGTKSPVSTGKDQIYPDDCGRDEHGKGNLCFPDGKLCQERTNRVGNFNYNGRLYWASWLSNDQQLKNTNWDWFNARNYCRKRCMDLVSFETKDEYDAIKSQMGGVKFFWTSGRLCDFDGCDRPDFQPKNINGWFWSANQARLSPTNSNGFHDWSFTGGFTPARRQPDNREQIQQNGASESCLAVLNNFYGDGVKWHDVACHHEKPIVCEDVEGHIAFARRNFPNLRIP